MTDETKQAIDEDQKVKVVLISYSKWFIGAATLAILASFAAYESNLYQPFSAFQIKVIQILSLLPEAAALGQSGGIQTWGGKSTAERLNERLFTTLTSIGFFLMVFSFQLEVL